MAGVDETYPIQIILSFLYDHFSCVDNQYSIINCTCRVSYISYGSWYFTINSCCLRSLCGRRRIYSSWWRWHYSKFIYATWMECYLWLQYKFKGSPLDHRRLEYTSCSSSFSQTMSLPLFGCYKDHQRTLCWASCQLPTLQFGQCDHFPFQFPKDSGKCVIVNTVIGI